MKTKTYFLWVVLFAAAGFGDTIEALVNKNLGKSAPTFPTANTSGFKALQTSAAEGDASAQKEMVGFLIGHIEKVYAPLQSHSGLFFSLRKPIAGYDDAASNYAVNLEEFFAATTDKVRVTKKKFEVKTKEGVSLPIETLKYRDRDESIAVKTGEETTWVPLADLTDLDRCFVVSALKDHTFESNLEISSEDSKSREESRLVNYQRRRLTTIDRKITLENNGLLPLENIVVEYQSFTKQNIILTPEKMPSDYRSVGFIKVPLLKPGEKKEFALDLPGVESQKPEAVSRGNITYFIEVPRGQKRSGDGNIQGVWVKAHRFTPYGERLEVEYKSACVPSTKWTYVTPVN